MPAVRKVREGDSASSSPLGFINKQTPSELLRVEIKTLLENTIAQENQHQKYRAAKLHGSGCAASACTAEHATGTKLEHSHEHSHGGVVIDLDEAVHGAYAVTKYATDAIQGNPKEIGVQFTQEVQHLEAEPVKFAGLELVEGGMAQTIAGMATSVAMLPLAGLAMHAGWEEFHHAKHELKDIEARLTVLQDRKAMLSAGEMVMKDKATPVWALVHAYGKATQAECKTLERAHKFASWDKRIGAASFTSGLFIALKAAADLALKVAIGSKAWLSGKDFFEMGNVAQATVAASTATTAVGLAGTVMGPAAGLASTVLGGYMWRKSSQKLKHLKQSFPKAFERLQWVIPVIKDRNQRLPQPEALSHIPELFMDFMKRQGEKRIGFFKRFARWNKLFTLGSGFYTASALTKALVIALAIGGVAALASNPIGLGVLVGVGILGAMAMGVGSFCFFYGHGKQGKYTGHMHEESQWVNRSMMVRHAHMASDATGEHKGELNMGSEALSLATFNHLETRKQGMHALWGHVAKQSKKVSQHDKQNYKNLPIWKKVFTQTIGRKDFETALFENKDDKIILDESIKKFAINDVSARLPVIEKELYGLCAELSMLPDEVDMNINGAILQCKMAIEEKVEWLKAEYGHLRVLKTSLESLDDDAFTLNNQNVLDLLKYWGVAVVGKPDPANADGKVLDVNATKKELLKYLKKGMDEGLRKARGVLFEAQLEVHSELRDPVT